jgi:hypothetical protein
MRGRIHGVDVDTSFFAGNQPAACSVDAIDLPRPMSKGVAGRKGPLDDDPGRVAAAAEPPPSVRHRSEAFAARS